MPQLILRDYHPSDFETLYALDQACYPRGIAYSRRTLRWFLTQPGTHSLIAQVVSNDAVSVPTQVAASAATPGAAQAAARSADRDASVALLSDIAGFIIAEAEAPEAHIITIDVSERHRRTGAGTALLQAIERSLAASGVLRVSLETATTNEPAVAFWKRHGYRSFDILPGYYLGRIDAYLMRKDLPRDQS